MTVSLRDSQGKVTFLNAGNTLYNGEACTATAGGNLVCTDATGQEIWSMLADGVGTGDRKDSSLSNTTSSDDDTDRKDVTPTPTPVPASESSSTPTPTPTPTPTLEERQGP